MVEVPVPPPLLPFRPQLQDQDFAPLGGLPTAARTQDPLTADDFSAELHQGHLAVSGVALPSLQTTFVRLQQPPRQLQRARCHGAANISATNNGGTGAL